VIKKFAIAISVLSLSALAAHASNTAQDTVSNPPYNTSSWNNGDNGGFGFGAWSFSNNVTAGGFAGEFAGGTTGDGNGQGWGLFASDNTDSGGNGNSTATATRPFTGGGMVTGQTFSLSLGSTSSVFNGATIGFNLLSGSNTRFTFEFTGGQSVWQLNDGGSNFDTTIPFTGNGKINFAFTYDGGENYDLLITEGATTYTAAGFTASDDISDIDGVKFFDSGQGSGQNFAFDVLSVPEPSTVAAGVLAIVGTFFLRRHRKTA
jgi:hypothetical protein